MRGYQKRKEWIQITNFVYLCFSWNGMLIEMCFLTYNVALKLLLCSENYLPEYAYRKYYINK